MKRFKLIARGRRILIIRESEEQLTAEQKYTLLLAAIGAATFLGFILMVVNAV